MKSRRLAKLSIRLKHKIEKYESHPSTVRFNWPQAA
jgi:hypothetical protein